VVALTNKDMSLNNEFTN